MASERIQKVLARAGIASRREIEKLIRDGMITVNGKLAKLGDKAELGRDAIKLSGKLITAKTESPVYVAFYKPRGVISTLSDPEGRPSLATFLGRMKVRVYPVGRLDFTSEGLLLMTNDGEFAEKLQKKPDVPRVYHVKVKGHPTAEEMHRLKKGVRIGRKGFRPHSVRLINDLTQKSVVEFVVVGAGAFDVRKVFMLKGFLVDRITRFAIGQITVKGMAPGDFKFLTASQVDAILTQSELAVKRLDQIAERAAAGRASSTDRPSPSTRVPATTRSSPGMK